MSLEPVTETPDAVTIPDVEVSAEDAPRLAIRSTMLDARAFTAVDQHADPFRRGALALLVAVGAAAAARFIGVGLDILTMPRVGIVQSQILNAITNTNYYANILQETPEFASQFATGYASIWSLIRLFGGYPSALGLTGAILSLVTLLLTWFSYGSFSYLVARWFGSPVKYKRVLGVMALAYTPILLTVINIIPGAGVPTSLIFALMLVGKFLAIRQLYSFGPGQNLAVLALPYVIGFIALITILIFAAAFGLNQLPIVDNTLRTLRLGLAIR